MREREGKMWVRFLGENFLGLFGSVWVSPRPSARLLARLIAPKSLAKSLAKSLGSNPIHDSQRDSLRDSFFYAGCLQCSENSCFNTPPIIQINEVEENI